MKRQSIKTNYLQTICWVDNAIVDFASAGMKYTLDGQVNELYRYTFGFGDTAITSSDGQYAFIYQKLGTKGLLLKNGDILREINRSYYYAEVYEYPAAFVTIDNRTFLVHCPLKYCRLDFEDVETGQIVTDNQDRNPSDYFHSRLEISPNGKYLMSKGWFWHPWDGIRLFDIKKCFESPEKLDISEIYPNVGSEICTASFIDDNKVLIGSSDEEEMNDELLENLPQKHIAIWDIELNQISKPIKVQLEFGNLFVINEKFAWDLYKFPKIINIETGEIADKDESLASGLQKSSIIHHVEKLPKIAFNRQTKQIAITKNDCIEILEQ
jgi:hypothetical protein